jgi:hypothetical protein
MTAIGDINADGFDDLLIGAPKNDEGGTDAGSAYIVFGPMNKGLIDLSTTGMKFVGETSGDLAGTVVISAGDLNGDMISDVIISAPLYDSSEQNVGAVYLIFGPLNGQSSSLANTDAKFIGTTKDGNAGTSIDSNTDVNKDGMADILVGAPYYSGEKSSSGAVHLILSPY